MAAARLALAFALECTLACGSESPGLATTDGVGSSSLPSTATTVGEGPLSDAVSDLPSTGCEDAVELVAADFVTDGREDWFIENAAQADVLVNARSVSGGVRFYGDALEHLPEFSCLESIDTLWIQKTRLANLGAFRRLERVSETLKLERNHEMDDLEGFDSLVEVGGLLDVSNNDGLRSYEGLSALRTVGSFSAFQNDRVLDLAGMPAIEASKKIALGGAFESILALADTSSPSFEINSSSLRSLDGFPVRPVMGSIEFSGGTFDSLGPLSELEQCNALKIAGNSALTSLAGLEKLTSLVPDEDTPGYIIVRGNAQLRDLTGLDNLAVAEGWVEIDNNPELLELTGLEGLTTTGQLAITANPMLANLDAVRGGNLDTITESIRVVANAALPECQALALCSEFPDAECVVSNNDVESTQGC